MDVVPSRGGCVCGGGSGAGSRGVRTDSNVNGTVAIAPGCRITSGADGMKYGNGSGSTDGNNGVGTTVGYVANALNATGCTEVETEGTNGGSTMPVEIGSGEGANVVGGAAVDGAIGAPMRPPPPAAGMLESPKNGVPMGILPVGKMRSRVGGGSWRTTRVGGGSIAPARQPP